MRSISLVKESLSIPLIVLLIGGALTGAGCSPESKNIPASTTDAGISILGTDTDSNGVRDDVQRAIDARYATSTSARAALYQQAVALQAYIRDAKNPDATAENAQALVRASECLAAVRGEQSSADRQWLYAQVYNSRERVLAYGQAQRSLAASGKVMFDLSKSSVAETCTFDATTMKD